MNMDNNTENMGTLGAYLKKTRELHGISIEELASSTKINISVLAALESDNFKKLPAPIFVKGFIRSYLKYLGVDPKEAILFYELLMSPTRKPDTKIDELSDRDGVKINKYKVKLSTRVVISALSVVIIVLSLVVYNLYTKTGKSNKEVVSGDQMVLKMSEQKPATVPAPVVAPANTPAPTPPVVAPAAPAPVAKPAPVVAQTPTPASAPAPATTAKPVVVFTQKVTIRATADLWVKVKIDDGRPFDFLLRTGGVKKLEATKELKVLLGDASAATIEYNGESIKHLGEKGFMRSIVFPGLGKWQDALVR